MAGKRSTGSRVQFLLCASAIIAVLFYDVKLYFICVNIATVAYYYFDKYQSMTNSYRVSESVLLGLSLMGGWIGALFVMRFLRHKSRKLSFLALFVMTIIFNIAVTSRLLGVKRMF
jgi:uncharacterized membrane protein YsdA (DUF1294 family)